MRISENVAALSAMNQQLKTTQNTAGLSQSAQKLSSGTKLGTAIGSLRDSFLDSSMLESQQSVSQRAADNMGVKPIYKAVIEELIEVNPEPTGPSSPIKPIYAARIIELNGGERGNIPSLLAQASQSVQSAIGMVNPGNISQGIAVNTAAFEVPEQESLSRFADQRILEGISEVRPIYFTRAIKLMQEGTNGIGTLMFEGTLQVQQATANLQAGNVEAASILKGKRGNMAELANTGLLGGERGTDTFAVADVNSGAGRGASVTTADLTAGNAADAALLRGKQGNSTVMGAALPGDSVLQGATNVLQLLR